MEVNRVCGKCGKVNQLNAATLKHADVHNDVGYVRLTYYKCVECGEKIVVQIDDIVSRQIFADLKNLTIKCAKKNAKHETISPKDIKRKDKLTKKLRERRAELETIYKHTDLYDENEKIFVKELTIL